MPAGGREQRRAQEVRAGQDGVQALHVGAAAEVGAREHHRGAAGRHAEEEGLDDGSALGQRQGHRADEAVAGAGGADHGDRRRPAEQRRLAAGEDGALVAHGHGDDPGPAGLDQRAGSLGDLVGGLERKAGQRSAISPWLGLTSATPPAASVAASAGPELSRTTRRRASAARRDQGDEAVVGQAARPAAADHEPVDVEVVDDARGIRATRRA